MTDPIADYLTRLRNALKAKHKVVEIPASNIKKRITEILFDKGFINGYIIKCHWNQIIMNGKRKYPGTIHKKENMFFCNHGLIYNSMSKHAN